MKSATWSDRPGLRKFADKSPSGSGKPDAANSSTASRFLRSLNAAKRVQADLRSAMRKLAEMPGMGHLRHDLADEPLRFWSVFSYLIIYRPDTSPLQIVRVLHGARDIKSILQDYEKHRMVTQEPCGGDDIGRHRRCRATAASSAQESLPWLRPFH